jgi:hypothetical protein
VARNRVTPFGVIEDLPGRGDLMGNRGNLRGERRWATTAWITCVLSFKGWRAADSKYTPLFFLDEVTALAAGHRPCALCRRADFNAFRDAFGATSAPAMDAALHAERTRARPVVALDDLPDGAMVALDDAAWLVMGGALLRWADGGYTDVVDRSPGRGTLLTPPSTVAALQRGYTPAWRPPPHWSR